MDARTVCGLLAEPDRLRTYAAVVLGAETTEEVAERSGVRAGDATRALRRLTRGGLLTTDADGRLAAVPDVFTAAVREQLDRQPTEPLHPDPARDTLLRTFIRDGRLRDLPTARAKILVVLEYIVTDFQPGVRFPEREVDERLKRWYDDHATLRRYLIDYGLMARDRGVYWRIGGPVEI